MRAHSIVFSALLVCGAAACSGEERVVEVPVYVDTGVPDTSLVESGPSCPASQSLCGSTCADTSKDPEHCGACGVVCSVGELCGAGKCATSCPTGQSVCGGDAGGDAGGKAYCANLASDSSDCGGCGTSCAAHEQCREGKCSVVCPTGQSVCGDRCVSLETDRANCGACATACAAGEVCSAGKCAISCAAGLATCGADAGTSDAGAGAYCANTKVDHDNCGACGNRCASHEKCNDSACAVVCPSGQSVCGDRCIATDTDRLHCGGCGKACASGQVCSAGKCTTTCATGLTTCSAPDGGVADGGADAYCANTQTDRANCGTCSNSCASGEICEGGTCVPSCVSGTAFCAADSKCHDLLTDNAHCGACSTPTTTDKACAAGTSCSAGSCKTTCATGLTACGAPATCTNTSFDPANCGACGATCGTTNTVVSYCKAGACSLTCATGFGNCNGNAGDGCEINTRTDKNHCGTCGNVCAGTDDCVSGVCVGVTACAFQQSEHPAYTTPARNVALCGNSYTSGDFRTACGAGWHVCTLAEWNARYPTNVFPNGTLTSWGASQAARCPGNVWEANRPINATTWSGNVCGSPYNPWNSGKYLVSDDGTTLMKGSGSCCSWDSTFAPTTDTSRIAVYCCR